MSEPAVLYEAKDFIATITLNRPENRNSMTEDVFEGLRASIARVKEDPELRCVIITGRGKSFCAGADFKTGVQRDVTGPSESASSTELQARVEEIAERCAALLHRALDIARCVARGVGRRAR